MATKHIGILAMQGAVIEHQQMLAKIPNTTTSLVKTANDLQNIDGLILPGGESTSMGKLLDYFALKMPLKQKISEGLPVFGTCAGLILLAKNIEDEAICHLGTMDITVKRNAYGSQLDSFATDLIIKEINKTTPLPLVFIRAPYITKASEDVQILAKLDDKIIFARQDNMLVSSFHPELTTNQEIHQYFLSMI